MDQLIEAIYQITIDMRQAIDDEKIERIDAMLDERSVLMANADSLKRENKHFQYSQKALHLLKEIMAIDQELNEKLKGLFNENKTLLQQFKKNKQVSIKYQPYQNQTNGVFFDKKN